MSAGQSVALSVGATGTGPLTYQWKYNSAVVPGATGPTLTLNNVSAREAGKYTVTVSNVLGGAQSAATLAVTASPAAALASAAAPAKGQFALTVAGTAGNKYAVQASTDMVNWISLLTNTAPFTFVDSNASKFNQRFYRAVYLQ